MPQPSEHVDLVALSLLPIRSWRRVGALLHEGRPPRSILEQVIAECLPQMRPAADALRSRALAAPRAARPAASRCAVERRATGAALAAITDPPPVLWARGNLAALSRPAVAIVGSRRAPTA
jgi:DNA processing protein